MKHFSASKIALLLAFASQVQGSAMVAPSLGAVPHQMDGVAVRESLLKSPTPLYRNACLTSRFGGASSDGYMKEAIYEADLQAVLEAFVYCPEQMTEIYHDKILMEGAYHLLDALKDWDAYSLELFYGALKHVLKSASDPKSKATVLAIYQASFIKNFPEEFYLDDFMPYRMSYLEAVIARAAGCKDKESKKEMLVRLLLDTERFKDSQIIDPEEKSNLILLIYLIEKLINGRADTYADLIPSENKMMSFMAALAFGRNEFAKELVKHAPRSNEAAIKAIRFIKIHLSQNITDLPAAYRIAAILFDPDSKPSPQELDKMIADLL